MRKGEFKLHKWHSNELNLETNDRRSQKELNFAKEHLGVKASETENTGYELGQTLRHIQSRNTYRDPMFN